jgi:NRPS condensation-like uncharacterized protein
MTKAPTTLQAAPDRARPNLVDRLFLRLEHTQTPLTIQMGLQLAGPLDPAVLAAAFADTLADYPLLQTLARPTRWGYARVMAPAVDPASCISLVTADGDWLDVMRRPMPPETEMPVRLATGPTASGERLVVTFHHSAVDAVGGAQWMDRLAWRYGERLAGRRPEPLQAWQGRRYRDLLWRQPVGERWRMLARSAAAFGELLHSLRGIHCATFQDLGIPSRGQVARLTIELDETDQVAIGHWRQTAGGTVNDVLLAAFLTACLQVWPDQANRPIVVHLPVNLREGGEILIGNRVADVRLAFANHACRTMASSLQTVCQATPAARSRSHALGRLLERGMAGYVPPAMFRRAVNGHLDQPNNPVLSLSFSNLGDLGDRPADFGPVAVQGMDVLGPLSVPPGISAWVVTCRGWMTLTIGYIDPVVGAESAKAVAVAFRQALRR